MLVVMNRRLSCLVQIRFRGRNIYDMAMALLKHRDSDISDGIGY